MQAVASFIERDDGDVLVHEYVSPRGPISITMPRYVRACRRNEWRLHLWDPTVVGTGDVKMVPYKCHSWRCPGECRSWRAKFDMRRILDALRDFEPTDVCFFVLTLDRNGTMGGRPWSSRYEAFKGLGRCARILLKRLNRALLLAQIEYDAAAAILQKQAEREGWTAEHYRSMLDRKLGPYPSVIGNAWVGTAEQHRSGWPHYNLIVVSPYLAHRLGNNYDELKGAGLPHHTAILLQGELKRHVVESGFGERSSGEMARSPGDVAYYIVKAASAMEDAIPEEVAHVLPKEVAKMSQVPEAAPHGFRRIRSGIRFLPPKKKSKYTGILLDKNGHPIGGAVDPIEQVVGLLGAMLGRSKLPSVHGPVLDPWVNVITDPADIWPELPGRPDGRRYQLKPHDKRDPLQRPRPLMLIPDPRGDATVILRSQGRYRRIRCRAELKPLLVVDYTTPDT